jgi:hypothetical protein
VVVLGVKRTDDPSAVPLRVTIGGRALDAMSVDGSWNELRWNLPADALPPGRLQARLQSDDPAARFAIDHLLLLPRTSVMFAARSDADDDSATPATEPTP